jgi:succinate dehydrogenase / fumarate reductase cytochrome b subunit
MPKNKNRPVFLDLTRIHQPVNAVLSIAHRATGIVLVLLIPVLVFLFDRSLASAQGYADVVDVLRGPTARVVLFALTWVFFHHLFAGVRYLLIDAEIGVEIRRAQASAWVVFVAGAVAAVIVTVLLP